MNLPVPYDKEFAFWQHCWQWAPGEWIPTGPLIEGELVDMWDRVEDIYGGAHMWFDRQGNPITVEQWGWLRELGVDPGGYYGESSYVRIGKDVIGEVEVSTVWLGMDHGFNFRRDETYRPVIFETMIFGGKYSEAQMRYCTEEEAKKGHAEAVADVRAGMEPWWSYGGQEDDEWHMEGR